MNELEEYLKMRLNRLTKYQQMLLGLYNPKILMQARLIWTKTFYDKKIAEIEK